MKLKMFRLVIFVRIITPDVRRDPAESNRVPTPIQRYGNTETNGLSASEYNGNFDTDDRN